MLRTQQHIHYLIPNVTSGPDYHTQHQQPQKFSQMGFFRYSELFNCQEKNYFMKDNFFSFHFFIIFSQINIFHCIISITLNHSGVVFLLIWAGGSILLYLQGRRHKTLRMIHNAQSHSQFRILALPRTLGMAYFNLLWPFYKLNKVEVIELRLPYSFFFF